MKKIITLKKDIITAVITNPNYHKRTTTKIGKALSPLSQLTESIHKMYCKFSGQKSHKSLMS